MIGTGLQARAHPRRVRDLQRLVHLLTAAVLLAYVYGGAAPGSPLSMAVRSIALPILLVSGMALWKWPRLRAWSRRRRGQV